jgi:hypothetical protein
MTLKLEGLSVPIDPQLFDPRSFADQEPIRVKDEDEL